MPPDYILDVRAAELIGALARHQGKTGNEVAVLLAGRRHAADAVLLDRIIIPRQSAFQTPHGCGLVLDGGCLNRVGPWVRASERRIHGILHSHPNEAYHSPTDDAAVLMRFHGAFSIVIPEFGQRPHLLDGSSAFRFEYESGWKEIPPAALVAIEDAGPFEVIRDD